MHLSTVGSHEASPPLNEEVVGPPSRPRMRQYPNSPFYPESLSKRIYLAKRNSSISIEGAPCPFSGSFVTPMKLGLALVIAEIRRSLVRRQIKCR